MQQRLIVFCAVPEMDVERVRRVVRALRDGHPELGVLEVQSLEAPPRVLDGGWSALGISPLPGKARDASVLEGHLEALVQSCAAELGEAVVGLYHDAANGYARACLFRGEGPLRRAEGDAGRVVRQTAAWIHVDARQLAEYFRQLATPPPVPSEPQAPAEVQPVEAEPDEDDRFVESKLRTARELMEQYRSARKSGQNV